MWPSFSSDTLTEIVASSVVLSDCCGSRGVQAGDIRTDDAPAPAVGEVPDYTLLESVLGYRLNAIKNADDLKKQRQSSLYSFRGPQSTSVSHDNKRLRTAGAPISRSWSASAISNIATRRAHS
ncbi:hypothetical protein PBRA_002198 [Plasmodiophora brassicae]|uniref:Uncharacterized protein n=1 Tax=Plasmodiophora brassicae TaxID=37360 RepID=A0A0G4J2R3_PLABS|nr:hypothetical protein PBRA_002198 [Plasmodiophora brassicae]